MEKPSFKEIWNIFSTGKGATIHGFDAISLAAIFHIAELEVLGNESKAQSYRDDFLKHEPRVIGRFINLDELTEVVEEIKRNTKFIDTTVYNSDGTRRYENLPDIGFMISENGIKTITFADFEK